MDDLYEYEPEIRQSATEKQTQSVETDWLEEYDKKETKTKSQDDFTRLRDKSKLGSMIKKIPYAELIFIFIASLFFHSDVFLSRVLNKIPGTVIGREVTTRGECTIALLLCMSVIIFGIMHNFDII